MQQKKRYRVSTADQLRIARWLDAHNKEFLGMFGTEIHKALVADTGIPVNKPYVLRAISELGYEWKGMHMGNNKSGGKVGSKVPAKRLDEFEQQLDLLSQRMTALEELLTGDNK